MNKKILLQLHYTRKTAKNLFRLLIFIMLSLPFHISYAQYLHTQGKKIVNGNNEEVILRGMGLGGWMLQEPYMLEMGGIAGTQHAIRAKIQELIGEENTNEFYDAWLANHCTRRDIDSMAAWGFNSVRLPMHYNLYTLPIEQEPVAGQQTWLEKGFVLTDSLLKWCAANHIYLILDLHAAPGGQGNDAAISDYDNTKPSLWQSEANKQKTIALWRKLAERYANEVWIGGYDLINETNWPFTGTNKNGCDETTNAPLRKLMMDITTAIREVDQHHIIYIEGNCWANNHNGIWPAWDNNLVLSFHKYWNYNDQNSINGMINLRNQYNVPLWLGESGENSNNWFTNAIRLMESNSIGWAWWPLKKVNSVVNPMTVVKNDGYNQLLNYWRNGGTKPTVQVAKAALMQLTENLKIENTLHHKDVIDAMFRQVNDATTLPYKLHTAPGVVHAVNYDLGRVNKAYYDVDSADYHVSTGTNTSWNSGSSYRNDGVDIQSNTDTDANANGYNIGWTADREWLQYTVRVDSSAAYEVTLHYAAAAGNAKIKLIVNGTDATTVIALPASGGYLSWTNKVIQDVVLYKGTQKIRLYFEKGGANVGYLKFALSKKLKDTPLKAIGATTSGDNKTLAVTCNKQLDETTVTNTGFSATVNNAAATITNIIADPQNDAQLMVTVEQPLYDSDVIKISYNSDVIQSTDETLLEDFTDLLVTNTLPYHIPLPGLVEAENFFINQGLSLETTTDTGGGQNIGYTNAGDYLQYRIYVTQAGDYSLDLRIASAGQSGRLELQQLDATQQLLNKVAVDIPVTGGWQTWQTINATITLTEGRGYLMAKIIRPEFNLNWMKFSPIIISGLEKNQYGTLIIYPNPTYKTLNVELPENLRHEDSTLSIINVNGSVLKQQQVSMEAYQEFYVGDLGAGVYIVKLRSQGKVWSNKFLIH